jgi:hypothetical protein
MKILSDGLMVLAKEGNIVFGILFAFLLASGIILFLSKIFLTSYLTFTESFSLSLAGVPFLLLLGASLLILLSFLFKSNLAFMFFPMLIVVYGFMVFVGRGKDSLGQEINFSLLTLILILIVSIYIRLAFISRVIVPPYFDSAAHNLIINNLTASYQSTTIPTFDSIAGGYYHLGFHVLMAVLSLALHANVKDVILVSGQIILALIPLPLFFFVKRETQSDASALFAVLLAGWGWAMPGYAINWGKYPALTSILAFECTLGVLYLVLQSPKRYKWISIIICIFSIGISTFIHSRSLVLTGITFICGLSALAWHRLPKSVRNLVFLLLLGGVAALLVLTRSTPILSLATDPYLQGGVWISLTILFLLPFAYREFPQTVFSCILSLLLLFGSLFIPVINLVPGRAYQTLLDRPFVEMVLFLPLSLLGGLGFAGLAKALHKIDFWGRVSPKLISGLMILILFGSVFANAFTRYDFYPSDCCRILWETDAVAFAWMDKNLPDDAGILIASFDVVLLKSSPFVGYVGSDAGIWLKPLINRKTFSLPYAIDFSKDSTWTVLRQHGITHIYVGRSAESFRQTELQSRPSLYKLIFSLPGSHVYEVIGTS